MVIDLFQRFLNRIAYFIPGGYRIRPLIHRLRGVHIGKNVWISRYVYIDELHPEAVIIEDNSSIGLRTSIFTHLYWGPKKTAEHAGKVHIDENVFIGPHCVILPNVHIGKNTVVQAGTVVSRDVPPETLWGLPKSGPIARVTIPLTHHHSYEEFIKGLRPIRK
jgi:acetyltransferase-like isoleucine patch superfamily enzyme